MIACRPALYDTMYNSRRLVAWAGDKATFKFRGNQIDGRRHLIGAKDMNDLTQRVASQIQLKSHISLNHVHR